MAVSVGKGRYCKLFSGRSQPKRLLIDDISEPGLLADEYVQGIVTKVFPIKSSPRYNKLCKFVLSEDLDNLPKHRKCATIINVFLLGDMADEGGEISHGDRVVLTQVIAESSPTDEHHFQLIAWREKSPVSMWVINGNGKVRLNTVDGVTTLPISSEPGEKPKTCEPCNDNYAEEGNVICESYECDFSEESVDDTPQPKDAGKLKGKLLLGPRGVTPSHANGSFSNMVMLNDKTEKCSNASAVDTMLDSASTSTGRPAVNCIGSIAVETGTQSMAVLRTPTHDGKGQSLSLRIQSASPTLEKPSNVQCTHIELTPSGVSTRVWNDESSFQSGQGTDPFQFAMGKDLPVMLASATQGHSQSTVVENKAGENIEQMPADPEGHLSEDTALPVDEQDMLPSPGAKGMSSTSSCQSHQSQTSVAKGTVPHIKVVDADLTPTSSVNSLIPKDYTPAESLLACSKGGVKRTPSQPDAQEPKRLCKSASPEPGPSQGQSPSPDRASSTSAARVRKTSQGAADYTVPPGYTSLTNLQPETTVNIYGVVKLFKPAWKCRGTDMCSVLMLMDPTVAESGGLECVSFQPSVSRLPNVQKVGDIVRLHRIKITQYQGRLQAKSSRGFAAVVFDRDVDLPVTAEMARVSSSTFTLTQSDKDTVESLKNWCEVNPLLFPPTNFSTVSQINPDCYFDLVCQVLGAALHRTLDCVVLFVSDGTQPKHDLRNCDGDDYNIVEPFKNRSSEDNDVISVYLYGSHAEVARLLAKEGEYIILHNVHSQILKPGGSVCSVLDVIKPYLELCVHRGTAFGRGVTLLSADSPEVKRLKRNQGLNFS